MFLWAVLLIVAAIVINVVGIRLLGSVERWEHWMDDNAGFFLAWRLMLYAGTAWGWIWMRKRLLAREPDVTARQRLRRAEFAAVLAIVALEVSTLLQ
ncbi:MAG: hypothetical protein AB7R40_22865 [Nitrospiraceae bacterium]